MKIPTYLRVERPYDGYPMLISTPNTPKELRDRFGDWFEISTSISSFQFPKCRVIIHTLKGSYIRYFNSDMERGGFYRYLMNGETEVNGFQEYHRIPPLNKQTSTLFRLKC